MQKLDGLYGLLWGLSRTELMVILLELEPGGKACNEDLVSALLLADMLFSYMPKPRSGPAEHRTGDSISFFVPVPSGI